MVASVGTVYASAVACKSALPEHWHGTPPQKQSQPKPQQTAHCSSSEFTMLKLFAVAAAKFAEANVAAGSGIRNGTTPTSRPDGIEARLPRCSSRLRVVAQQGVQCDSQHTPQQLLLSNLSTCCGLSSDARAQHAKFLLTRRKLTEIQCGLTV